VGGNEETVGLQVRIINPTERSKLLGAK
jgi:hypothetical protein